MSSAETYRRTSPRKRKSVPELDKLDANADSFRNALSEFAYTREPQTPPPKRTRTRSQAAVTDSRNSSAQLNSKVERFEQKVVVEEPSQVGELGLKEEEEASPKAKGSAKAKSKPKPIQMALEKPHPAPPRWRETYDAIRQMRKTMLAPVDGFGCADAGTGEVEPKSVRLSALISLMLSSQTKDEVTHLAVKNLRAAVGGSITLESVLNASDETIQGAICKVGFWRRKTQYIKEAMQNLKDNFDGDVPKTVDELCSLNGVGPKMAFLCLQSAWNIIQGIGVDVHVHRITNRLGWHKPPTQTPEQTRLNLQSWLPDNLHADINPMLVGFGQTICLPVAPKCDTCTLPGLRLCPAARSNLPAAIKRSQSASPTKSRGRVITVLKKDEDGNEEKVTLLKMEDSGDSTLVGDTDGVDAEDVFSARPKVKIEVEEGPVDSVR